MTNTIQLSPVMLEEGEQFCEVCEENTFHVCMPARFHSNPSVMGYLLECEPCSLSWDWQ